MDPIDVVTAKLRKGRISDGAEAGYLWGMQRGMATNDDPENAPIAVMDGNCALCSFGARMIHRLDRRQEIRICPIQTERGRALLAVHDFEVDDPESWIFLENGNAFFGFDAMIRVGERSGGWGRLLSPLRLLPRPARDWLYKRIARNRYALFGQRDMCAIPDPALRARLIS